MRNRRPPRGTGPPVPAAAPPWMVTYGDLVTQVLAFFILLYSFSSINEIKFRETLSSLQSAFGFIPAGAGTNRILDSGGGALIPLPHRELQALQHRLEEALQGRASMEAVGMEVRDVNLIIRFDAATLFDSGSAAIRTEAIEALDAIGQVLATIPNPIRIEGHTDSDPMIPNPWYPDNWMLSGARATSVLRFFGEFHGLPYKRFSFAGYADTRPVADNTTADGKALNRRVEIVVLGGQPGP